MVAVWGSSGTSGNGSSVTISATSGGSPRAGDLRISVGHASASSGTWTVPAGWTTVFNGVADGGNNIRTVVMYRVFQSGDGSVSATAPGTVYLTMQTTSLTGGTFSTDIQVATPTMTAAGTTHLAPGLVPAKVPGMLIAVFAPVYSSGANTTTYTATPAGMSLIINNRTTAAIGFNTAVYQQTISTAADTGTRQVTMSASAAYGGAVQVFVPDVNATSGSTSSGQFFPFMSL